MLNACAAPEDTPEETYSSHKVHTPGISFKLLLAAVVVALWSSVLTAAYFRTGDGRWVRFVLHPPSLSFALPILVSHAAVSFRPREPAEAAEACEGAVVATGSPASRPSSGLTASQLLVAASATLAVALNSEAMRYDHVRVGIALFAISLCLFLVRVRARTSPQSDSPSLSLSTALPLRRLGHSRLLPQRRASATPRPPPPRRP